MANLITLAEYKEYKGINSISEDAKTESLITRTSEFIKKFTNKTFIDFVSVDKIEYFDALNLDFIFLDELPVISITSAKTSVDGGVTQTTIVENTDFFIDLELGQIISNNISGYFTNSGIGFKSLEIAYRAGYAQTPEDIKQANMDFVAYYLDQEYTPKRQFASNTIENMNFREESSINLPGHIQRILEYYREL